MRVLCLLAVAACTSNNVVVGDLQEVTTLKAIPNHELDVLFVVDNSPSMLDKQQSLATNFPRMIDVLATLDDGVPDLHIGVVTSDLGTSGSQTPPGPTIGTPGVGGCAGTGDAGALRQTTAMTAPYLADGTYTGALRDAFATLARVGDGGCGFEQHLGAMRRALDSNATNAGFLRDSANLAVVILADEDDCSVADSAFFGTDPALGPLQSFRCFQFGVQCDPDDTTPGAKTNCHPRSGSYLDEVASYADFLVNLKGDARKVMVAGVVGDPSSVAVNLQAPPGGGTPIPTLAHSCTFTGPDGSESADPAVRIASFLDQFPGRARLTSICNDDLSGAVADIGHSAKQLMGDPCLDTSALADTSDAPGVQPACEVTDVRDAAPSAPSTIPPCDAGASTCYELAADPIACPSTPDHLRIQIRRAVDAAADTWTHVRCQRR
ncbi:MAG TPA: hypothetical protein VLT45_12480 [Kofleriaceae bacterium]|nr:hypothetical protein [Kofleriaceae bacterium]